jgi:hypothetical protein
MNHDLLPDTAEFERMQRNLLATIDTTGKRRTRRHRLTAIGIAGALAVATTAGAIAIARAPQSQINYTVDCYAAADLGAAHGTSLYLPGDRTSAKPTLLGERISLAEDMCRATWEVGTFVHTPGGGSTFPVPNLVTCQLPDSRLAVFPANQAAAGLCTHLGLTTPHD